jgi:hypothetical protein
VVAGEDDDRVLGEPAGAERLYEATGAGRRGKRRRLVDVRDGAEIGAPRLANLSLRHRLGVHRADMAQAARMRIERGGRDRRSGEFDDLFAIKIPVALRDGERIVRMGERGDDEERRLSFNLAMSKMARSAASAAARKERPRARSR